MSQIILPAHVAREIQDRRRSFVADLWDSIDLEKFDPQLEELARTLQSIDSRLLIVRARERVVPGVPMKPGYYHLLVRDGVTSAIPNVTVIEGDQGEFVVPTWRVVEKLWMGDMTQRRNTERWKREAQAEYDANEREKAHDKAERQEHLRDLVNAYTRTSISTTDARPWTQNTQPAAVREAGERKGKKR